MTGALTEPVVLVMSPTLLKLAEAPTDHFSLRK